MNAGQELDAAVAKALGERVKVCTRFEAGSGRCLDCDRRETREDRPCSVPPYSTSWEAAGRLCEEMRRRGWALNLYVAPPVEGLALVADAYFARRDGAMHRADAPTAPEALALAALRALGREGE